MNPSPAGRLGLGTYRSFDRPSVGQDADELLAVLKAFHAAGGRWVDSSPMYGQAESTLGALSQRAGLNASLKIATKVWTDGREAGLRQMESSLKKLGRSRLELMQVHNLRDFEAQWPSLEAGKATGRYAAIGITHYTESAFADLEQVLTRHEVDWLQIPYNIGRRGAEKRLLGAAADRGVKVIANEPLDTGRLFSRVKGRALPEWVRTELGITTWAAYFLKFLFGDPRVTLAIPATSKLAHLKEMLPALEGALPTPAQRERMVKDLSA